MVAAADASELSAACEAYGTAEVVFIGRAQPQMKHTLVYDFGIDKARKDLNEAEAELKRHRASLGDPPTSPAGRSGLRNNRVRSDQERDLLIRALNAQAEVMAAEAATPPPQELTLTPMHVEVAFRGVTGPMVFMWLPAVPAPLEVGRSYLVYGSHPFAFSEIVESSSLLQDTDSAQEDLRFLYSAAAATGATIYGSLKFENPHADGEPGTPLAGVKIQVSTAGSVIETITKDDGSFVVSGVPAGRVELNPLVPERLTVAERYSLIREVRGGGCVQWFVRAALNGRVRGRVFREDGRPLPHVQVDLIPVDPKQARVAAARQIGGVRTNEYGEFEFSGQPPGAYWLGINLSRAPTSGVPYPATFFPGTTNPDGAEPIVIGQGTEHNGLDFVVSDPLARGQLEVVLDTGDAAQTNVYACVSQPGQGGGVYKKPLDAPLLIDVVEGSSYRLNVHADTRAGHVHSEALELSGTAGRTLISLNVTHRSESHGSGPECGASFFR